MASGVSHGNRLKRDQRFFRTSLNFFTRLSIESCVSETSSAASILTLPSPRESPPPRWETQDNNSRASSTSGAGRSTLATKREGNLKSFASLDMNRGEGRAFTASDRTE